MTSQAGPTFIVDWATGTPPGGLGGYRELIRVPALAVGRFIAAPGHEDTQEPHTEDEIYFITAGEAHLIVGTEECRVQPGSIAYVPAGTHHRFTQIIQELEVLVFFAAATPAE